MVTDKKGNIFEDRRKQDVGVKKDKRKSCKTKKQTKTKWIRIKDSLNTILYFLYRKVIKILYI